MTINITNDDQKRLLLESLENKKNALKDIIFQSDNLKECEELFGDYVKIRDLIFSIIFAEGDK